MSAPDPVLAFIQSGVKPLCAAEESLSNARDRVARLEAELVAARLEVEIAERKHRGHLAIMADAFDLLHQQRDTSPPQKHIESVEEARERQAAEATR